MRRYAILIVGFGLVGIVAVFHNRHGPSGQRSTVPERRVVVVSSAAPQARPPQRPRPVKRPPQDLKRTREWMEMLRIHPQPAMRAEAATRLAGLVSDEALPEIRQSMRTDLPEVADRASRVIGRAGTDLAGSYLAEELASGDDQARAIATRAIASLKDGALVQTLLTERLTTDPSPRVRRYALCGLANRFGKGARERVEEALLGDPAPEVRAAAVTALARLGKEEAAPLLSQILDHETDARVLDRVALALQ